MNSIQRNISVTRKTFYEKIEVIKGTNMIPIILNIVDFVIPITASAVAYVIGIGESTPRTKLCEIEGNKITIRPTKALFSTGTNVMQIRVIDGEKALITFEMFVRCGDNSIKLSDQEEEQQQTLIEQLLSMHGYLDGSIKLEEQKRTESIQKEKEERTNADSLEKRERLAGISAEKEERQKEIDVERKRINNLAKLQEGGTTGDAELLDIRIGGDGTEYPTAGDAVRKQTVHINKGIEILCVCKNLIGMNANEYYPVYIPKDSKFTISTKSKEGAKHTAKVWIYNAEKGEITYWSLAEGVASRTITATEDIYYLLWAYDPGEEIQIEKGDTATGYVKYFYPPVKNNLEQVSDWKFKYYGKTKCPNFDQKKGILTIFPGVTICNEILKYEYELEEELQLTYDSTYDVTANWLLFDPSTKEFTLTRYSATIKDGQRIIGEITRWGTGWTIGGLTINGTIANIGTVQMGNLSEEIKRAISDAGKETTQTQWIEAYEKIRKAQGKKFAFCVQTDTHYKLDQSSVIGTNMKQLSNNVGLDFACNLGDILHGYEDEAVDNTENMQKSLSQIITRYTIRSSCPMLLTIGNHDPNTMYAKKKNDPSLLINEDELYARIIAPSRNTCGGRMKSNGRSNYYYVDFEDAGIRVIMLNSTDGEYKTGFSSNFIFSEKQVTWFKEIALKTENAIMVMTHTPLLVELGENIITNGEKVLSAIKAFKEGGGSVIGCFYGHVHAQKDKKVDGINHITFIDGGYNGEVVLIDQERRSISTIGINSAIDRNFTY